MKEKKKLSKPWQEIKVIITIKGDDKGNIWEIHLQDYPYPLKSIAYDGDYLPSLEEILEDFDN